MAVLFYVPKVCYDMNMKTLKPNMTITVICLLSQKGVIS